MATANYSIVPGSGWTLVATDPGFLRISTQVEQRWSYAIAASLPADDVVGVHMDFGQVLTINEPFVGNVYVRPRGVIVGKSLRFDVTTLSVSGSSGGGDASAANQSTQITAVNLANTQIGGVTETAPASDTASSGLNGRLQRVAQRLTSILAAFVAGPLPDSGSLSVVPSASQNPIYDHANGTKTSVTTSATVITPPAGCQFVRISSDVDVFVNAAGSTAVDDGTSIRIIANSPEIIPVTAATAVVVLSSSGTAVVRCTPFKVR